MIRLLYFAWVRERLGRDGEEIEAGGIASVADLLDRLEARGDAVFAERARLRVAVNQMFAQPATPVADGDEVAIFPPVTGG
jgi:molybdopterin converting factor subunit 1